MVEKYTPPISTGLNQKKSDSEVIREGLRPIIKAMLSNPTLNSKPGTIPFVKAALLDYLGPAETEKILANIKNKKDNPYPKYAGIINEIVHDIRGIPLKRKKVTEASTKATKAPEVKEDKKEIEIQGELFPGINVKK
jgi:hypothetical protein